MNSDNVEPHEILYRGIKKHPDMWKDDANRPTSAAFKQTESLSVDRDGDREYSDIEESLLSHVSNPLKAIAYFPAQKCIEKGMQIRPDPNPDGQTNPYHALIDESSGKTGIGKRIARYLALACDYKLIN